jgi:hypothetical protein
LSGDFIGRTAGGYFQNRLRERTIAANRLRQPGRSKTPTVCGGGFVRAGCDRIRNRDRGGR